MSIFVSSGTKLAAGSGRTVHITAPRLTTVRTGGGAVSTTLSARQGVDVANALTLTAAGTGTGVFAAAAVQGAIPVVMNAPAAADLSGMRFNIPIFPIMETLSANPQAVSLPTMVWRLQVMVAFPALAGAIGVNTDLGLVAMPFNNSSINNGGVNRAGIMFGPVSDTQIGLRIRRVNAGALTLQRDLTFAQANVTDHTKFNVWELRFISATSTQPAQLKALINGVQFGNPIDCSAAAAIVPAIDNNGNGFSFGVSNGNPLGGAYAFRVTEMHYIISAFEDDAG